MSQQFMVKRFFILLTLLCCIRYTAFADHIFGGELFYKHVSGNSYTITLTLYNDCSALQPSLIGAEPEIHILDGETLFSTISLDQDDQGIEVSPVCPKDLPNTSCRGGTLPGVRRFIFSKTITLNKQSSNWRFIFSGSLGVINGSSNKAGRSLNITNIGGPNTNKDKVSIIYLEATLNSISSNNSSPEYTTIPTPFYCDNVKQQYNQGASDPDEDSLSFSLIDAIDGGTGAPVNYISPYSGAQPMATSNFTFNALNGQMNFTPNLVQDALIVNRVDEYRNGEHIGSSMREMTFVVLPNCTNNPPEAELNNVPITGGLYNGNNTINACTNDTIINFLVPVKDPDHDSVSVNVTNIPQNAIVTIVNNNTPFPQISLFWNTKNTNPGIYNIYVHLRDNACPISSSQTTAYTIHLIKPAEASKEVLNPTHCLYSEHVRLPINYGITPRIITITDSNGNIRTYSDTVGTIDDFFPVGKYHVTITSPNFSCPTDFDFQVADEGSFPYTPVFENQTYCQYDTLRPFDIRPGHYGNIIWYNISGDSVIKLPPAFNTDVPGTFYWLVSEKYKVCESKKDSVILTVHPLPRIKILNQPEDICLGNIIDLKAIGAKSYVWTPSDKVMMDRDSNYSARILEPTTYTVKGTDTFGCKNLDSVSYENIKLCCTLSYPNAFTPNGDNINDKFHVLHYGNLEEFHILIYNRWGVKVFETDNPDQAWDGKFGGRICDMDTYYYIVQAKCYTGYVENHKGYIILIR